MGQAAKLTGKTIAILATDGFEQSELLEPQKALEAAGAATKVVSPKKGTIRGWKGADWGESVPVDIELINANVDMFDALLLPGGVMNPDKLRILPEAVAFVKGFVEAKKPIGAICHGPWTLIEAGGVKGKNMTSWPALKSDLTNAGAKWEDKEVIVDLGLVTSRKPADIPAFNAKLIEAIAEGAPDRPKKSGAAEAEPETAPATRQVALVAGGDIAG